MMLLKVCQMVQRRADRTEDAFGGQWPLPWRRIWLTHHAPAGCYGWTGRRENRRFEAAKSRP